MVVEKIQIETSEIDLKDTQIFKAIFNMFYPRAYTFTLKLPGMRSLVRILLKKLFFICGKKRIVFTGYDVV